MKPLLLSVLLTALVALPASAQPPANASQSVYQVPLHGMDQHSRPFQWNQVQGKPVVVSMFYGSCHVMCPLILQNARAVQKSLPANQQNQVQWVMISLDPKNDTPQALAKIAQQHHLTQPSWSFVAPSTSRDVLMASAVLGVKFRQEPNGEIAHDSTLVLLDTQGNIAARTQVKDLTPDAGFAHSISSLLAH